MSSNLLCTRSGSPEPLPTAFSLMSSMYPSPLFYISVIIKHVCKESKNTHQIMVNTDVFSLSNTYFDLKGKYSIYCKTKGHIKSQK